MRRVDENYFARSSEEVAKDLLGKKLVRLVDGKRLEGIIAETGAFYGKSRDKLGGEGMYNAPGKIYIMKFRGLNFLNVGTDSAGIPSVVHIRSLLIPENKIYGPGKLTKEFNIDSRFNGKSIDGAELWIEDIGEKRDFESRKEGLAKNCIGYYKIKL